MKTVIGKWCHLLAILSVIWIGSASGEPEITEPQSHGLPSPFLASPFASEFVTTGAESVTPAGEHYFPSNGDGTFGPKSTIPGLGRVDGTDVADMDGDGDNDFLVCDGLDGGLVSHYTNNGGGSFTPTSVASSITNTSFCTYLRIDDFDKDGLPDFVVGDNRNGLATKVYIQGPAATFTVSDTLDTSWTNFGNNLVGVAAGDINGDGNADILMLGKSGLGAGQMRFYAGNGTGVFAAPILLFNIGTDFGVVATTGLAVFDLEGDGDLDIIAGGGGGFTGGTHFIYTNDGTGNFTKPSAFVFDVNAQTGLDAFDADGDGDDDLVVATFLPRTLLYVENLGGTLAAPVVVDSLIGFSIGVGAPPRSPVTNVRIDIDIKPGKNRDKPNNLDPNSPGKIKVAILGTSEFDALQVDQTTIRFGPLGAAPAKCKVKDTNKDDLPDLSCKFKISETGIACGDTEATLSGETFAGDAIIGMDAVNTVKCP